jgi:hypothetical protein
MLKDAGERVGERGYISTRDGLAQPPSITPITHRNAHQRCNDNGIKWSIVVEAGS